MRARTRRLQLVAMAAVGVLGLSACGSDDSDDGDGGLASQGGEGGEGGTGGDTGGGGESIADLPPKEIAERAQQALQDATSLRIKTLGDPAATGGVGMDLHMDQEGSCEGSITQPGAGMVELLVRKDDEVWMKPDALFWQTSLKVDDPNTISLLDGHYLYGHTSDPEMSQMAGTCSLTAFQSGAADGDGSGGPNAIGPETEYNGTPVVSITGPDEDGNQATMLVAAEGEPYPLLMRSDADGAETEIELSQYNEPVDFQDPPADVVLNVADFRTGNISG